MGDLYAIFFGTVVGLFVFLTWVFMTDRMTDNEKIPEQEW